MMKKKWATLFLLIFLFLILASEVVASEEEASHSSPSAWVDFAGKVINFIILFGGLTYLLYRPLRSFFQNRSFGVQKKLEELADNREEAERTLSLLSEQLAKLEEEIEKIRAAADEEGKKEKEKILTLAKEEASRIARLASLEIEAMKKGAVRQLKSHAAALAVALAEARIREKLNPEVHRRLIRRSMERLAKLYESNDSR